MSSPKKLVFHSFFHSQGSERLQAKILQYFDKNGVLELDAGLDALAGQALRAANYAKSAAHTKQDTDFPENIVRSITETAQNYDDLSGPPIKAIRDLVLAQDYMYTEKAPLVTVKGLLVRAQEGHVSAQRRQDRAIYKGRRSPSHLMLFGVAAVSTGLPEYDALYREAIAYSDSPNLDHLHGAARGHVEQNPQDREAISNYLGEEALEQILARAVPNNRVEAS